MHKIKEMLHKDDDSNNNNTTTESRDLKHSHDSSSSSSSSHSHSHGGKIEDGHLSTKEFKNDHIKHGEIEHGHGHQHVHTTTTTEHTHHHHGGERELLKHSGNEKHIYHDREVVQGGDLYRSGQDPTLNREVVAERRHDGEVKREVVGEAKIVKEKIKEVELHKVQPVIHREREQKEIRHIVEPHQKFEVKDTKVLHKEKDIDLGVRHEASTLETSRGMDAPHIEASREHLGTERQHQELPMRVEERVHKKIVEHVHPVIYKETLKPKVTEETHHIYETVKEKPIETYEVKELHGSRGIGLQEAERSFFTEHGSRGIEVNTHAHSHGHSHEHSHEHSHLKEGKHLKGEKHIHSTTTREVPTAYVEHTCPAQSHTHTHAVNTMNEPIVGHHQNIGAHHVAGAIPAGHNTAYDAALCNECTGNQVCSHGERDAALMQKMNEKKIVKDKSLKQKEKKKLSKSGGKTKGHKNVNVV